MWMKRSWVLKQDAGDGKMKEISDYIYEGALAFLKAEYRLLAISWLLSFCWNNSNRRCATHLFIVIVFLFFVPSFGFSWKYGNENSNQNKCKKTQAARTSLPQALKVSLAEEP
jgi:K(+)-stimulated pyrophosphate-energized sodium pump